MPIVGFSVDPADGQPVAPLGTASVSPQGRAVSRSPAFRALGVFASPRVMQLLMPRLADNKVLVFES